MRMTNPKLQFIYAYPFDRERRSLFESKNLPYPSVEEVHERINTWSQLWEKTDDKHKIIEKLSELTKRVLERSLECFVFGAGFGVMSAPFLLPIWNKAGEQWSDEKFIDLMIHESLHIFQSTNNERYWKMVKEKYADEEPVCRNHILLYAMLYEIYQTLFDKEPIDWERDNLPSGYARAISLVKEEGYQNIITEYYSLI